MEKIKKFIKELRLEYKILIFFILILIISAPFTVVKKYAEKHKGVNGGGMASLSSVSEAENKNLTDVQPVEAESVAPEVEKPAESSEANNDKPSSISEAINSNRPLIISENESGIPEDIQSSIFQDMPETKGIEMATKVEHPTIWVYTLNDGNRKDQEAAKYCVLLSNRGIIPNSVFIYDEKERGKGNLAELGFAKCMN